MALNWVPFENIKIVAVPTSSLLSPLKEWHERDPGKEELLAGMEKGTEYSQAAEVSLKKLMCKKIDFRGNKLKLGEWKRSDEGYRIIVM